MPYDPPGDCEGHPRRHTIPAGTPMWRVHSRHRDPAQFNTTLADSHVGGGRFCATAECRYPYLYVSMSPVTALAEKFLRSMPFESAGKRVIPHAAVAGRRLTKLTAVTPLTLLPLVTTPDLAAVCQDEWLVHAEPRDYGLTRRWAHWLRGAHPWTQGLLWQSRRNLGQLTAIVFGDRITADLMPSVTDFVDLDDAEGAGWVNDHLAPFTAMVPIPTQRRPQAAQPLAPGRPIVR